LLASVKIILDDNVPPYAYGSPTLLPAGNRGEDTTCTKRSSGVSNVGNKEEKEEGEDNDDDGVVGDEDITKK
jgi:hypothetical protein